MNSVLRQGRQNMGSFGSSAGSQFCDESEKEFCARFDKVFSRSAARTQFCAGSGEHCYNIAVTHCYSALLRCGFAITAPGPRFHVSENGFFIFSGDHTPPARK